MQRRSFLTSLAAVMAAAITPALAQTNVPKVQLGIALKTVYSDYVRRNSGKVPSQQMKAEIERLLVDTAFDWSADNPMLLSFKVQTTKGIDVLVTTSWSDRSIEEYRLVPVTKGSMSTATTRASPN